MIHDRFTSQFGNTQGSDKYSTWLNSKGYNEGKEFPKRKETKELTSKSVGIEIKEFEGAYHLEGLVATTHVDNYNIDVGMSDRCPKETLDSFAEQINTVPSARVMGVHHSEGVVANPEYFGVADIEKHPAKVISLSDGEFGLFVDTKLLKDDPEVPGIIKEFQDGTLNSFSITYDASGEGALDFEVVNDNIVRVLTPETVLHGYTAASNPVNPHAISMAHGFKEFKELVGKQLNGKEVKKMPEEKSEENIEEVSEKGVETPAEEAVVEESAAEPSTPAEDPELKELREFKAHKKQLEEKELLNATVERVAAKVASKMEVKEKVLKDSSKAETKEVSLEMKEFMQVVSEPANIELKEQFRRAAAVCDNLGIDWQTSTTSAAESREFKSFGVNGTNLEFKGLGITTNQNTDTDYLQSSAELQDVYDPIIYNALNQKTVAWNLLAKDDFSSKGNNQVQFTLKIAANTSAAFYTGNAVATGNVTRLKYQTKFKKLQVGVSIDGDMIAAARGGPVSDVFAQEVMDSTEDMMSVLNLALFAEVGLETAAGVIGFEYITDSAGNTSLYNLTRSAANKLAPDSAGDTYINQASTVVTMTNLRAAIRQAVLENANKSNLVYITSPVQADMLRSKFDDARRLLTSKDTDFGFSTDLWVDGIPVFEDKDCNTDDWFLVDLETHRVGLWVPPTIERLGKNADSQDAFIKMYFATYNRAPRRMVQIYGCATS
ncbi:MAG: SU10 major capsid protein [Candidatus Heimdallarchaeaceae archaeon]